MSFFTDDTACVAAHSGENIALVCGGETTVTIKAGKSMSERCVIGFTDCTGRGGRNQEMVLACLDELAGRQCKRQFAFISAGGC
jgi:glycerate-2-kinase